MIVYVALAIIACVFYNRTWLETPSLHEWRSRHLREHGEASWQIVIIAVSILLSIVILALHGDEIPQVLTQGFAGILAGIGAGEITLGRYEKKTAKAVHAKRHTTATPHPSKKDF